jgi:hypothetical protein
MHFPSGIDLTAKHHWRMAESLNLTKGLFKMILFAGLHYRVVVCVN